MMFHKGASLCACCFSFIFTSHAFAGSFGKLRLIEVEVLTQREIPAHDKYWAEGQLTEPLLRVTFSTDVDLERFAREGGYNIDNRTAICRGSSLDPKRRLNGFPSVLDSKGRIDEFRTENNTSGIQPPFEYRIYFDVKQSGYPGSFSYDLSHDACDVCITVNGAQETLFWITDTVVSEPLVVPAGKIAAAISAGHVGRTSN